MILLIQCGKLDDDKHKAVQKTLNDSRMIRDWRHVLASSWLVDVRDDAELSAVRELLKPVDDTMSMLIVPLHGYTGYMNKDVWTWIQGKDTSKTPVGSLTKRGQDNGGTPQSSTAADVIGQLREIRSAKKLEDFIGMEDAAAQLRRVIAGIAFRQNADSLGLSLRQGFANMILMGPPGVGKTALAQSAALLLRDTMTASSKQNLYTIQAADLIGRYTGQSANNTKAVLEECKSGVLVFDEIDTLLDVSHYGTEILNTLNTYIGHNPNSPVIIATMYGNNEHRFRSFNAGLSSRFPYTQRLPSYDDATLAQIFAQQVADAGLTLDESGAHESQRIIAAQRRAQGKNFGHAREVGNIFQVAVENLAQRFGAMDDAARAAILEAGDDDAARRALKTLSAADIPVRDADTGALTARPVVESAPPPVLPITPDEEGGDAKAGGHLRLVMPSPQNPQGPDAPRP